ncbi:MAG: hypothetical protein U0932_14405 [Thiobacillus sp.]|jgi:hypothetical protein|nr:hypothetical protein [Thiobacillus sp.]
MKEITRVAGAVGTIAVDMREAAEERRWTIQRRNRDGEQKPTAANTLGGPAV